MSKKLQLQTNGLSNGHAKKPTKSKLKELKDMQKELEMLIKEQKKDKKKHLKKKQNVTVPHVVQEPLLTQVLSFVHDKRVKNQQEVKQRLEAKVKMLEKHIRELQKDNAQLQENVEQGEWEIGDQEKQLKKKYPTSSILQLIKPTLIKSKNPIVMIKNLKEYMAFKKQYDKNVKTVATSKSGKENVATYKASFLEIHPKHLVIGERFLKIYYLAGVPQECSDLLYFKLLASPIPFSISIFVEPTTNGDILKTARRRISALEAVQAQREKKGLIRDPQVDKDISETTNLADNITYERERAMIYGFYCALEANSLEELTMLEKAFINETESMELVLNIYSYGQERAFRNFFPYDLDNVKEDHVIESSGAAVLMPFVSKSLYDPKGIFLGTNVYHNSVVFLNPFTSRNNNVNIFGVSGAGKSVTSKILASRMFMQGTQIIIIDPEGEYVKLARKLGGEVIQFSRDNGINPFHVYGKTEDEILSHISTLKTFFKFFIPEKMYNSALLDTVLIQLYKKSKKQNFNEFLQLLKDSPMQEYLKVLYEGSMQGIFTSERKLDLDNEFIVFDLSELKKDEKRAPAMYLLTSILWSLVNSITDRRRMLFIDEAHMLLTDPEVAEFYRQLVKVARKRDLGVVSITQDVEDFLDNDLGKAIITNSETKILLKQSYATLGLMDKIYPMTPEEKKNLGSMRKGEVVIFRENEHIGAYIQVLPSERDLVLTQESQSHEDE